MKIEFRNITLKNWDKLKENILKSELIFPEGIRSDEKYFVDLLHSPNYIARVMFVNGEYAGNTFAVNAWWRKDHTNLYKKLKDLSFIKKDTIFGASIVVDEKCKGMGLGEKLFLDSINQAREKGYKKFAAFCRPNNSLPLLRKFGAEEISEHENWFGTGETYVFCELDIDKIISS